jgi:hypothetical protein
MAEQSKHNYQTNPYKLFYHTNKIISLKTKSVSDTIETKDDLHKKWNQKNTAIDETNR